jgi:serine/threonine-protein kinase
MNAPNWARIKEVFQEALDRPPQERIAWLQSRCGDDKMLEAEVESLLAAHQRAGSFGDRPALELLGAVSVDSRIAAFDRALDAGTILGVYEILSRIGAGGMGEVYKARDTRLDRIVAIKVLPGHLAVDRDRFQRVRREARAVASLDHPHIGALYDIGEDNGRPFLVMQFLEGETLAARLANGVLPVEQALRYAIDIADALAHAHRRGVVHRDLKPGNIFLTQSGARLIDFGLAKWRAGAANDLANAAAVAAAASDSLTEKGHIVGTLHYMAPEQLEGKDTDIRTDIFAFGAVVYEMVTGRRAFDGDSSASVIAAILGTQPPPLASAHTLTSPALDHVVTTCLAKDPEERWQSAADLRRELQWASQANVALGASPQARAWPRWRSVVGIGLLALIVGGVVGVMAWNAFESRTLPSLQVTRSIIAIPPAPRWSLGNIAVSPNGTHLVYRVDGRLVLRSLDDLQPKPIAGADDGTWPFFSPDGEWVGFLSHDLKLKRVALAGSVPQTICDAPDGIWGATWGLDNTVVFTKGHRTGLFKVPATGGIPQPLTTLDAARREKSHRLPHFLPDGKAVLFTVVTADMKSHEEGRIAVVSLDTGERRVLLDGGTSPRFAASGHIVFARNGTLVAVPFDPQRLEIRGQPVAVLDGVHTLAGGQSSFSMSRTGLLAYTAGTLEKGDGTLVRLDRRGVVETLIDTPRAYFSIKLSPDAQQLAVSIIGTPNDQVWLFDLSRRTFRPVTFEWDNRVWAWTPDGKRIVISSDRDGPYNLYWQIPEGGGSVERLTEGTRNEETASWTPDGKTLVFGIAGETTQGDIQLLALDEGRKVRPLINSSFDEGEPALSPDGHWLAYSSDESGQYEIYLQPFPDLSRKWQVSTKGGETPAWDSHGNELYYLTDNRRKLMSVPFHPASIPIGSPQVIAEGEFGDYAVAPDGRFIVVKAGPPRPITEITLVQNWFEELTRRVPAR